MQDCIDTSPSLLFGLLEAREGNEDNLTATKRGHRAVTSYSYSSPNCPGAQKYVLEWKVVAPMLSTTPTL